MARHTAPEAEVRRALAEGMKAGFAMGFDEATALVDKICESTGESPFIAVELRKLRLTLLKQRAETINQTAEIKRP
jgi:hypothetical protein